ncbi:MAG: type VII toxin-antitoxin system HepT family RNase toxin [Promethearchaeota archaeon]
MDQKRIQRYKEKEEYFNKLMAKLKEWTKDLNVNDFVSSLGLKDQFSIYHAYQIILELTTDLAAMVIKDLKLIPKDDYVNMDLLAENKIISKELAYNLKQINGLRNIVVHNYNGLDEEMAFKDIQKYHDYLKKYKEALDKWLQKES